jgi:hypothetical protein
VAFDIWSGPHSSGDERRIIDHGFCETQAKAQPSRICHPGAAPYASVRTTGFALLRARCGTYVLAPALFFGYFPSYEYALSDARTVPLHAIGTFVVSVRWPRWPPARSTCRPLRSPTTSDLAGCERHEAAIGGKHGSSAMQATCHCRSV